MDSQALEGGGMGMKHYTLEQWKKYVGQDLTDEDSADYETHLSSCEPCLELYMQSLEVAAESYPVLVNGASLANKVMLTIAAQKSENPRNHRILQFGTVHRQKPLKLASWVRHPLFHYTVAAAVTLALMSSGIFQSIADRVGQVDRLRAETAQEKPLIEQPSVSKKLMEKTIVMLDSIQPKHEKGGTR
jgi:hypothetical protein